MLYLILGMLVGALLLVAAITGLKYLAVVILVLAGILVLTFVHHRYHNLERFLVLAFIPLSSLKIDFHLMRVGGKAGFEITPLDVIWGLLMILWLVRLAQGEARVRLRSVLVLPLMVILVGALSAAARSYSLEAGVRGIFRVIQFVTLFVYLLNRETSEREARLVYWSICLTLGLQSLLGVLQGMTGSTFGSQYFGASRASFADMSKGGVTISRVGGSIGHSNDYALYLNSLIFVPFAAMVSRVKGLDRTLGSAVFLLGVAALAMSKSRGGWVGFAFCFLLFAFVFYRERFGAPKAALLVVGLALILATLVLITPATRERLFTDDYGAAEARIPMAMTALNVIAHHPLLGVGTGNYMLYYFDYGLAPEGEDYEAGAPVHNAYLLIAAESGILVLLAYLAVLLAVWRAAFERSSGPENQRSKTLAYGVGMGLLAQAIIWQVELASPLTNLYTWFLMGMAVSLSQVGRDEIAGSGDAAP